MKISNQVFPAKVLLFGEYSVINGGNALVVPFNGLHAQWKKFDLNPSQDLLLFISFLSKNKEQYEIIDEIKLDKLSTLITQGWVLESTIPIGAGLGSSGSVCAAILTLTLKKTLEEYSLETLMVCFSKMEAFFHGVSSGIDPLIPMINKPIVVNKKVVSKTEISKELADIYIIDSSIQRSTKPLVTWYKKQQEEKPFLLFTQKLQTLNDQLITQYTNGVLCFSDLKTLSKMQFENMSYLIPKKIQSIWDKTLQTNHLCMKLCGAGGGGTFLLFSNRKTNPEILSKMKYWKL